MLWRPLSGWRVGAVLVAVLLAANRLDGVAADVTPAEPAFPPSLLRYLCWAQADACDRLDDGDYARLASGLALQQADPQALFSLVRAAAESNQLYKALYVARLLTTRAPDNLAAWQNRATLAAALGLSEEAAACRFNAETSVSHPVRGGMLPGVSFAARPSTLADWAAALALMSDDVTAHQGRAVVAIRSDVSGVLVPPREVIEQQRAGPWVDSRPIEIEHVLPNAFVIGSVEPMRWSDGTFGLVLGSLLSGAAQGYLLGQGAVDAATSVAELTGSALERAMEAPSYLKGGTYESITFAGGSQQQRRATPKSSGQSTAIGLPRPLLWATGPSSSIVADVRLVAGKGPNEVYRVVDSRTASAEERKAVSKGTAFESGGLIFQPASYDRKKGLPLQVLKLERLWRAGDGGWHSSPPLTLHELLLSEADMKALVPSAAARRPDLGNWERCYERGERIAVGGRSMTAIGVSEWRLAGLDARQAMHVAHVDARHWVVATPETAPRPQRASR